MKLSPELLQRDNVQVIKSVSLSGLLMLVGMVMYISVFKAEVGSKLRPRSSFQVSQISKTHLMFTSSNKEKRKGKAILFSIDINLNIFNLKFQSAGNCLHFTNFRKNKSLCFI